MRQVDPRLADVGHHWSRVWSRFAGYDEMETETPLDLRESRINLRINFLADYSFRTQPGHTSL